MSKPDINAVPAQKRHLANNYESPGLGWVWMQPDPQRGGWWQKDEQRRYPVIYAESEG